jgi:hypothetical protein
MKTIVKRLSQVLAVASLLSFLPAVAQAEITYKENLGTAGAAGGQVSEPAGLAVKDATGDLYVADRGNNRVAEFSASGAFVRAWGYDVVQSGEDNKPNVNEVDEVRIRATSGSYSLIFKGEETAQIPHDAAAAQVQSALNALTAINTGGGSVTVTKGPGDPTGSTPYVVTFSGVPLARTNVDLSIEPSGLGIPSGAQLSCEGALIGEKQGDFEYQWLANGLPVAGATQATFVPGAGDEGKAIQCRVTAGFGGVKTMAASRSYNITSPAPATLPPLGPASLPAPSGNPILESLGGTALTCSAGSWKRAPENFTYRWYRNGVEIGSPTTTAATTSEYALTEADVATRAVFQCAVTGNNAGGSSTVISKFLPTKPAPTEPKAEDVEVTATLPPSASSRVLTRTNGGPQLETCKVKPPSTDVCKAGVAGNGFGQLDEPRSIAVDNSPSGAGSVYVADDGSPRVQKFSASGTPIFEIGAEVDQTSEANVCTASSGDACGPGAIARGEEPGAFGEAPVNEPFGGGREFAELGNQLGVDAAGNLYVGDPRGLRDLTQPRIEKFGAAGNFLSQAKIPYLFGNPESPTKQVAIAVDSEERAFASIPGEGSGVEKFPPSEFSLTGDGTHRPGNLFDASHDPVQLTVDPRNDRLLVSDRNDLENNPACGEGASISARAIVEFDSAQNQIDCSVPVGAGSLAEVNGLAVSSAGLLYAAVGSANTIKVFELPVPVLPQIAGSSATEITTETALIHGQINPGFEDTTYQVEFGLEECETHPCQTVNGGVLHGLKYLDGTTPIAGLEPNTTYHYRVIAENPLGTVESSERTFTTFARVDLVNDPCPNALARKQTKTVGLLDCRAYELVSAGFAGGYDVESDLVPGESPYPTSAGAPGRLIYGVHEGGIPGTGHPTNRGVDPYIATRGEDGRWSTRYVGIPSDNPFATEPFSSTVSGADSALDTFAFAGNICNHCFADGSSGLPVHLPGDELVQGMVGSEPDPSAEPAGYVAKPLSADGSHLVFGTDAKLEPKANEGGDPTIYSRDLAAGTTEIVSTDGSGVTLTGAEIGELDVSADGSRVLTGRRVSTDAKGNSLWHLYLHRAGDSHSVDLMPGAATGAFFDGMTEDGSTVFFTTTETLLPGEDEDESPDIYEAQVGSGGVLALSLVSTRSDGTPSNDDSCTPSNEPASWNSTTGEGKCGALALAGGAGLATASGSFFFLSPEQLEGSEGAKNQPNLYVVEPGGHPHFVATIDTSEGKPGPKPPAHPLVDSTFGETEFEAVEGLTVDQSNHDLYAIDAGAGMIFRYDSTGAPHDFSAGPHTGNALTGFSFNAFSTDELAVDNHVTSPLEGDLYVTSEGAVGIFAPSGEELGALDGSGTALGAFGSACGVAVDQSTGTLYVGDSAGFVWQYTPAGLGGAITDADYTVKGIRTQGMTPCALAVDTAGHLYAARSSEGLESAGPVARFSTSEFASSPTIVAGVEVESSARAIAVDPSTNELYVDKGNLILAFDPSGNPVATIGQGKLSCGFLGSRGVAVDEGSHHVFASCFAPSAIKEFGYEARPYTPVDNPAILHASHPASHSFADFQITPQGHYAVFASSAPLKAGYDNASHYEVYRYGSEAHGLTCISCDPTGSQAHSDASLPPDGIGILEDGRVFFNTGEQLTLSDTDAKLDAYEFSPQRGGPGGCNLAGGCQQLISTGTSAFPSGMFGVTSDGSNAFFFTRDVLVEEDQNGQAMKIYDARTDGGHFVVPPPPPCAASDECHGPGTQAASPPQIGSLEGTGGNLDETPGPKCKKGFVNRNGKCVKKKKHKQRHHRTNKARRGGGR